MTSYGNRRPLSAIGGAVALAVIAASLLAAVVSPAVAAETRAPWSNLLPQPLLDFGGTPPWMRAGVPGNQPPGYLVGFHDLPRRADENLITAMNGTVRHRYRIISAMAVRMSPQAAARLAANPRVAYVEPDLKVYALAQQVPWGIARIGAPVVHDTGNTGAGIKVAIIDTGIDYNHPDLAANYKGGYDFVNDDSDPMDDHGHGTHCAGTVAAADNSQGVIGVAPEAWLYGLKMLSASGEGDLSDAIAAIEWCVDNGIDVASMSWGAEADPISEALQDACAAAYASGVVLVAAAGNDGYGTNTVNQPAILDSVIAVSATDQYDNWAWFSSTGPAVELAAPGVGVLSTWRGGSYATHEGTSMACPHVAGTAALIIASGLTGAPGVRERLRLTAQDLGTPGWNEYFGYGLVRADWAAGGYDVIVTGIAPKLGSNDETVSVTISGLGFKPGATPQLAKSGHSPIVGTGVTVVSGTQVTCEFNLLGAAEGAWDVVVTNPDTDSGVLPEGFYVMGPVNEDFETGDFSRWPWNTYGAAQWTVSDAESHTGTYAARAGSVPMGGSSFLEITLNCEPGTFSFFKKLSCPAGMLIFYVNGTAIGEWTGVSEWDTLPVRYQVPAGVHTFRWEYWDLLGHSGTVWLDDMSFPPLSGEHIVAITSGPSGTPNPIWPNGDVVCSVGVYDSLGHDLSYLWSAEGDAGSFDDPTLASPTWTAPATPGDYQITVTVTCAEDGESSATASYTQQVAEVIVTGITPDSGTNDGVVSVTISGIGFETGATTQLARSVQSPIVGTDVTVVSDTQITCDFNLLGAAQGYWDVVVTNPDSDPAVLPEGFTVKGPVDEDFETGDFSRWPWKTYGDAKWTVSDAEPRTGTYAARAGSMSASGSSFLEITLTCEAGDISFYRKLSCFLGLLIFYVNGNPVGEWSGVSAWDTVPVEWAVPAGTHTFKWEYWDVVGDPSGTVWLDDISFPPIAGQHNVTIIAGPSGTPNPVDPNADVVCSVTATDSLGHDLNYLWSAQGNAGSFDDSSARNPTWTAPATAGNYEITVKVTCAKDEAFSATASYVQEVEAITYPVSTGYHRMSIPGETIASAPSEVLASVGEANADWLLYDYLGGRYYRYPHPAVRDFAAGRGYWLRVVNPGTLEVGVTTVDPVEPFAVDLPAGWSILGCPFHAQVPWDNAHVQVDYGGSTLSLTEAVVAGWLYPTIYKYEGGRNVAIHPDTSAGSLEPWQGYLINARQDVRLLLTADVALPTAAAEAAPRRQASADDWRVSLVASAGGFSDQVVVGLRAARLSTAEADQSAVVACEPHPPLGPGVSIVLASAVDRNDGSPGDAISLGSGTAPSTHWELTVHCPDAGVPVTITWPDLSEVPADLHLYLEDRVTAERLYMRTTNRYTFVADAAGAQRQFRVEVTERQAAAGLVTALIAQATATGGAELVFTLSADASVDVIVMNIAGRVVRQVVSDRLSPSGLNRLLWDGRGSSGAPVPSGRYLVHLTARTDDGQVTNSITSLAVQR